LRHVLLDSRPPPQARRGGCARFVVQAQETAARRRLCGGVIGVYREPSKFADNWRLQYRFKPAMSAATRERKLAGWARAVKGLLVSDEGEG
jgi:glycerol kinase